MSYQKEKGIETEMDQDKNLKNADEHIDSELNGSVADRVNLFENQTYTVPIVVQPYGVSPINDIDADSNYTPTTL